MSRKIILIKQELLLLVYELNRSGLLAENEKIRPILAQLEKDRKSGSAGMPRPISYAVFCLKKKKKKITIKLFILFFFFFLMIRLTPRSTLFPYTTLFRSFHDAEVNTFGYF